MGARAPARRRASPAALAVGGFASDLTQQRIAERVGVSQVHVSRILHGALIKLRAAVGEGDHFEEAA
jgi:DNA-binding transcriptional regulator LsrR (DeoR family)